MGLNKSKGNMYPFVTHTWNAIKGKCLNDCIYCYMKNPKYKLKAPRLDRKELRTDLEEGNFIFVGSSTDMFARDLPYDWIIDTLKYCNRFDNQYLFQTKNPEIMGKYLNVIPPDSILACTVETDYMLDLSNKIYTYYSPTRGGIFATLKWPRKMVSIEPVVDFNTDSFIQLIEAIKPEFVSIGADSQGSDMFEPSKEKLTALIAGLETFTKVIQKKNLKRLYGR